MMLLFYTNRKIEEQYFSSVISTYPLLNRAYLYQIRCLFNGLIFELFINGLFYLEP